MKNLKFKKIVALTIIMFSVCLIIVSWYNSRSVLSVDEYLSRNNANVNLNEKNNEENLKIFNKDLNKYDVFLAGESHGIATNYDIKLQMIKYLNHNSGVRYLLEEMSYSDSADIQQYLETGNEDILKDFYAQAKGTASWSKESYEFWRKLRVFNETLPDDRKIRVVGIDMQYTQDEDINYLYSCLPVNAIPVKIKTVIEEFKGVKDSYSNKDYIATKTTIEILSRAIEDNSDVYKEYLGDKYFDFTIVLNTLKNMLNTTKETYSEIREECIYNNFKKVYNHFPKGKYFGQWGAEHVYQNNCESYINQKDRFAMCLNREDSPVKNRVLSIRYLYKDCYRMAPEQNYKEVKSNSQLYDIYILNKFAETDITVFDLNEKRTPFADELHFVAKPTDGATLDYFQYIILIKKSKGTRPLGE